MNKLYEWESEAIDYIGYLLSGINDVLGSFRLWRRLMVSSDRSSLDLDRQELFQRLTDFEMRIASRYSTPWK